MSTETPDPLAYLGTDRNARQLFKDANSFLTIIDTMLDDEHTAALEAANPHIWIIEQFTGQHKDRAVWHLGFVLALEELSKHPDILQFAVRDFYHRLAEYLPAPFTILEDVSPETKRTVLELIARLLDDE